MKGEWKKMRLGEVADVLLGKMLDAKKNKGVLRPYLNNVAVRWGRFDLDDVPQMRIEDDEVERYKIVKGDIVVCEGGEPGRCAIWNCDEPIFYQKALHRARVNNGYDNRFVYYQFCNLVKSGETRRFETGSTIRHLPRQEITQIELNIPPLPTQKKIAAVLGSLDDKIENNRKICATLEEQAQAIFKSWFVDFEPWGGKMPKGWREESLSRIADYLNGLAMQKYRPASDEQSLPVLKIKELRAGACDADSELCSANIDDKYIVRDGDVVFSWSGSLLVDFWCGGDVGLNQHLFKVTSDRFDKWFIYEWTKHHLAAFVKIAADKATTMGHITRDHLEEAKAVVPTDAVMREVGNCIAPMLDEIVTRRIESRTLSELRDALLPKLMSGEIDVNKVEI